MKKISVLIPCYNEAENVEPDQSGQSRRSLKEELAAVRL